MALNTEPNPASPGQPQPGELSYFQDRMNKLGITEEQNKVDIWRNDPDTPGKSKLVPLSVFTEGKKWPGIDIHVYTLDRGWITYKPENSRWSQDFCITRLKEPRVNKDGSIQKYHIPKGAGTYPFFHPSLIEQFEKKQNIDTLFLIEGYFKAWKACMHGIPTVGLSSITHMKEKDKQELHGDIKRLMLTCNVKRMVWLTDGDCLDITSKELTDGIDLFKRPNGFFNSCKTFKTLLDDYDVEKWFFHIDADNIISNSLFSPAQGEKITRDQVKGLDDLLGTFADRIGDIKEDVLSVSKQSRWFNKHNITFSVIPVRNYFHLVNVNDFYLFHSERRPEMKNIEFVFDGTRYQFSDKDNDCKIVVPAAAKLYFRVGDGYYKFIEKVNQFGAIEKGFSPRLKTTIIDDHGRDFCKHIPKYEEFCNYPDHQNFRSVINNNFNVYYPFEHEPSQDPCDENDCPNIMAFFKHIFGEKEVVIKQKDGSTIRTAYYQLGLDLVQLLYQKPTQRLPILCLVSRDQETGKSTWFDLLKAIFTNNAAIVGNSDLADDFNSFWASKLLIMVDETKIEKQVVVERVKSLTFARKIPLSSKGKDKKEIDFFGHFMMNSNNEDTFLPLTDDDLRFWIIKVPRIKEKNPDFLQNMTNEIPEFLAMLNSRKIVTPRVGRMWFDESLLKTEAARRVIAASHSMVKKELTYHLKQIFLDFGVKEILMTCQAIKENFFKHKENNYIERVLKDEMKLKPVEVFVYNGQKYDSDALAIAAAVKEGIPELEAIRSIEKKGKVMRHQYPRWDMRPPEIGKAPQRVAVLVSDNGRPYRFVREDFLTDGEDAEVTEEIKFINDMEPVASVKESSYGAPPDGKPGDLPF
jgi:hypothetical protein